MNSQSIFQHIDEIARTSSKNEKQALVKEHSSDPEFCKVLEYAYNPFKTYGIAAIPNRADEMGIARSFTSETWMILDLLIARKLTGNAAREAVQDHIDSLDIQSAELFRRILKKDLRAGFSESTINKAIKGLIPDFPYMRCCLPKDTNLNQFDWLNGVISQEKADGMFANINYEIDGLVTITSRQGSPFPIKPFAKLLDEVGKRLCIGAQHHGELLVKKGGKILPREQSNGVLNSVLKGGEFEHDEHPIYQVWDAIPLSAVVTKGKVDVPYSERLKALIWLLESFSGEFVSLIPTRIVRSLPEAYAHYAELLKQGKEGTIIKDPHAIWRDGTSKQQVKLKLEVDVDLVVVGFLPGEGKNAATFGSIVTQSSDGLLEVAVSGFTDQARKDIHANAESMIGSIMAVKANSIMNPSKEGEKHSLFLPRFVEFRTDKTEADSLQRVKDQFESAVKAA
jgi:DNA ligase-1